MTHQNSRRRLTVFVCGMPLLLSIACSSGGIGPREYTLLECGSGSGASASGAIGAEGGTVTVGGHSLTLPANAVSSRVTFRIVERQDKYVGVEVEPHGTQFNRDATLALSYARCQSEAGRFSTLQIVEVKPGGTNVIKELGGDWNRGDMTVLVKLEHLSGYLISGT